MEGPNRPRISRGTIAWFSGHEEITLWLLILIQFQQLGQESAAVSIIIAVKRNSRLSDLSLLKCDRMFSNGQKSATADQDTKTLQKLTRANTEGQQKKP